MNTNTSTVVVENGFIADALIHVQFAPGEFFALETFYKVRISTDSN